MSSSLICPLDSDSVLLPEGSLLCFRLGRLNGLVVNLSEELWGSKRSPRPLVSSTCGEYRLLCEGGRVDRTRHSLGPCKSSTGWKHSLDQVLGVFSGSGRMTFLFGEQNEAFLNLSPKELETLLVCMSCSPLCLTCCSGLSSCPSLAGSSVAQRPAYVTATLDGDKGSS